MKYCVLYYPRSTKAHKKHIKGKMDGILTYDPSTARLTLSDEAGTTVSGKLVEAGSGESTFAADDVVSMGKFEAEIMHKISGDEMPAAAPAEKRIALNTGTGSKPLIKKSLLGGVKKSSLLSRKRPIGSVLGDSSLVGKKKLSATAALSMKAIPVAMTTTIDSESDMENNPQIVEFPKKQGLLIKKKILASKKFQIPTGKISTSDTVTKAPTVLNRARVMESKLPSKNPSLAPFAHLKLTTSLLNTMYPHQLVGSNFLLNCFTGEIEKNFGVDVRTRDAVNSNSQGSESESESESVLSSSTFSPSDSFSRYALHSGAILADEMGLGKTIMTIACIYSLFKTSGLQKSAVGVGSGKIPPAKFIVVTPASLVKNWFKEFDKWLGRASQPKRVLVTSSKNDTNQDAIRSFCNSKQSEVLLISYEQLRLVSKSVNVGELVDVRLLVCDEGHRLKGKGASSTQTMDSLLSIPAKSRLIISGSVHQNDLTEFYNLLNFVNPGLLGDLSEFRKKYSKPIEDANTKKSTREQRLLAQQAKNDLNNVVKLFLLRRTNEDISCTLPPRYECAVFCRPSDVQCELYTELTVGHNKADSLVLLTKLRKLCSHPSLLLDDKLRLRWGEEEKVPAKFVAASKMETASKAALGSNTTSLPAISSSGKMEVLEQLLRNIRASTAEKVVVISNFTNALDVIEQVAIHRKWGLSRLDGTTSATERQGIVDTFNRSSASTKFLFLLSSKAGGVGLNLVGANRLVMFDADWNPATDAQAMGRIYRTGQRLPCFIYRLFLAGTVEEVIFQRQLQKGNLALENGAGANGKEGGTASEFSKEELRDCFTLKANAVCETNVKFGGNWATGEIPAEMANKDISFEQLVQERKDLINFVRYGSERDARRSSMGGSSKENATAFEDEVGEDFVVEDGYGKESDVVEDGEDCLDEDGDIYFDEDEDYDELDSEEEFI